ncbi:MAG: hypothetical protein LC754_08780, partial [Acidobacteria bacterium]|nr:hypothetical protein [Acidobacteriota bacterium]
MFGRIHHFNSKVLTLALLCAFVSPVAWAQQPGAPTSQPTYTPAPSANSPQQTVPPQSPQTASPTQSQTQQSTNPAASAQTSP